MIFDDDGIYVWKFYVRLGEPGQHARERPGQDHGRALQLPVQRPADAAACRSRAWKRGSMRRATRSCSGWSTGTSTARESIVAVHSVNTAAGGGGVRWYEFRLNEQRDRGAASAGHVRARPVLPLDGQSGHRPAGQHRHWLLVRRHTTLTRDSVLPRVWPTIHSVGSWLPRDRAGGRRRPRRHRPRAGKITRSCPWIRSTTARSGTWATI